MGIISPEIGIDLGTSNVLIYVQNREIVLREPSLVIASGEGKHRKVIAIGEDARVMQGRLPQGNTVIHPIRQGVIADFEMTVSMLRYFVRRALGVNILGKPRAVITVPSEITPMERRAVEEAAMASGLKLASLCESVTAAAIGCRLPVYEPIGHMIVDMGGGTTEIGVISMGGKVVGKSVRVGGDTIDEAIREHLRVHNNLLVGEQTAEDIKIDMIRMIADKNETRARVRGRDTATGKPREVELDSAQLREVLQEPMREIERVLVEVLSITPLDLIGDIVRGGIYLTGGCSQLSGMDQYIAQMTGIRVQSSLNPLDSAACGAGYLAANLELLDKIGQNHPLTE